MAAAGAPVRKAAAGEEETSRVWGEYRWHARGSRQNIGNALLCAVALWPSIAATVVLFTQCDKDASSYATFAQGCCALAMQAPIGMVNVLFFLNVTLGFWLVGLVQRSFWLIDPYWTVIPPLIGHFYQLHPRAGNANAARSAVALTLTWVWSVRLTHSYFRREDWKFGEREDWRYTKMARENPKSWWILSLFAVGLAQQPMLCGITMPLASVHLSDTADKPFGTALDILATVFAVIGIVLAYFADNQLRQFMEENAARKAKNESVRPVLNTGVWRYSRHPNYVGEQTWWWALGLFSVLLGEAWALSGTAFNSLVLAVVTVMTEQRMLKNWAADRADQYRNYQRETAVWIPIPFLYPWKFGCPSGRSSAHREDSAYERLSSQ